MLINLCTWANSPPRAKVHATPDLGKPHSSIAQAEHDGFYGTYYENPRGADCAMIGLFGDGPNDYMAKCGARWPLAHENIKVGIMGMSTAGMEALVAASCFPDITLTFGLTASDFVWQGFEQGKRDGCREWPVPGASTLSYRGEPLPYMPFVYEHPTYWEKVEEETEGSGDFQRSTWLFIDSEKDRPHPEDEMIKIENIQGKLVLIGADDDGLWEAGKYVRRMDQRLRQCPHACDYEAVAYTYGTHFALPESMLRIALPIGLKFVMRFLFRSAKEHPGECEATRIDVDRRLSAALHEWVRA